MPPVQDENSVLAVIHQILSAEVERTKAGRCLPKLQLMEIERTLEIAIIDYERKAQAIVDQRITDRKKAQLEITSQKILPELDHDETFSISTSDDVPPTSQDLPLSLSPEPPPSVSPLDEEEEVDSQLSHIHKSLSYPCTRIPQSSGKFSVHGSHSSPACNTTFLVDATQTSSAYSNRDSELDEGSIEECSEHYSQVCPEELIMRLSLEGTAVPEQISRIMEDLREQQDDVEEDEDAASLLIREAVEQTLQDTINQTMAEAISEVNDLKNKDEERESSRESKQMPLCEQSHLELKNIGVPTTEQNPFPQTGMCKMRYCTIVPNIIQLDALSPPHDLHDTDPEDSLSEDSLEDWADNCTDFGCTDNTLEPLRSRPFDESPLITNYTLDLTPVDGFALSKTLPASQSDILTPFDNLKFHHAAKLTLSSDSEQQTGHVSETSSHRSLKTSSSAAPTAVRDGDIEDEPQVFETEDTPQLFMFNSQGPFHNQSDSSLYDHPVVNYLRTSHSEPVATRNIWRDRTPHSEVHVGSPSVSSPQQSHHSPDQINSSRSQECFTSRTYIIQDGLHTGAGYEVPVVSSQGINHNPRSPGNLGRHSSSFKLRKTFKVDDVFPVGMPTPLNHCARRTHLLQSPSPTPSCPATPKSGGSSSRSRDRNSIRSRSKSKSKNLNEIPGLERVEEEREELESSLSYTSASSEISIALSDSGSEIEPTPRHPKHRTRQTSVSPSSETSTEENLPTLCDSVPSVLPKHSFVQVSQVPNLPPISETAVLLTSSTSPAGSYQGTLCKDLPAITPPKSAEKKKKSCSPKKPSQGGFDTDIAVPSATKTRLVCKPPPSPRPKSAEVRKMRGRAEKENCKRNQPK